MRCTKVVSGSLSSESKRTKCKPLIHESSCKFLCAPYRTIKCKNKNLCLSSTSTCNCKFWMLLMTKTLLNVLILGFNNITSLVVNTSSRPSISILKTDQAFKWSPWSTCKSKSGCGNGTQSWKRLCKGETCPGDKVESKPCQLNNCPGNESYYEYIKYYFSDFIVCF